MRIKITGINGYLGQAVSKQLKDKENEVSGVARKILYGDIDSLQNEIKNADVVIHLAGAPILQRWTNKNKDVIYDSRITTTTNLVKAINALPVNEQPKKFISASAVGIYKSGFEHDENSTNFDSGFVGNVVKDWENASVNINSNIHRTIFRIGIVIGKQSKTITYLKGVFNLGLGGTIAGGNQAFPYIHIDDLVNAFTQITEGKIPNSTYNLVAPEIITNKQFTNALAKKLKRPAVFNIPKFALKIVLGEASSLLIESPIVSSKKIVEKGFSFKFPNIDTALSEILDKKKSSV